MGTKKSKAGLKGAYVHTCSGCGVKSAEVVPVKDCGPTGKGKMVKLCKECR